jgi:hypothetical protein
MSMTSDDRAGAAGDGTGGTDAAAWKEPGPLMDLVTPMALRVAATLRLADFMPDGTARGGDLAECAGADPDAPRRRGCR